VKEWMGHADVTTTMRYLHYTPRPEDAALVAEAFAMPAPAAFSSERAFGPRLVRGTDGSGAGEVRGVA
jgi:hypothetical protein